MSRKIGLAGAGMVSYHHLLAWQSQRPRAEVVAIADPGAAQAAERASAFGIGATFSDARTMMDTVALDALDVAAPREVHAQIVELAAERGIPVLCQKPLAPTLAEAEALVTLRRLPHAADGARELAFPALLSRAQGLAR